VLVTLLGIWLLWRRTLALGRAIAFTKRHHSGHVHGHGHSHAPDPQPIRGKLATGTVSIVDTDGGERLQLDLDHPDEGILVRVLISRDGDRIEEHGLTLVSGSTTRYQSAEVPAEPHEFKAVVQLSNPVEQEDVPFEVHEPEGHDHSHGQEHDHSHEHEEHDHASMSDEEHARAHSSDLPEYVRRGERPTPVQVMAFGAAGGLVPCPAAVSVMLLSVSVSQSAKGLVLVLGFSIGLAITLVGLGLLVVTGMSRIASGGRLSRLTAYAPSVAAVLVILSGIGGLIAAAVRGH
jgi:ABC-type nickel/cobalt efflux system permease component RcnA